ADHRFGLRRWASTACCDESRPCARVSAQALGPGRATSMPAACAGDGRTAPRAREQGRARGDPDRGRARVEGGTAGGLVRRACWLGQAAGTRSRYWAEGVREQRNTRREAHGV